ncbi:hypothetical protein Tco_1375207 [Tanacetum coccineum]
MVDWRSTMVDWWLATVDRRPPPLTSAVDRWSGGQYEVQVQKVQYEVQVQRAVRGSGCTRWLANRRLPRGQNDKMAAVKDA